MSDPRPAAPASSGHTSTGLDPRVASVIAYSAWWLTGLVLLGLERVDPIVRFHAAQSTVLFGVASAVIAVSYAAALPLMLLSSDAVPLLMAVANVTWLTAVGLWAWLIVKAARGERWCVPGIGGVVSRLADRAS